MKSPECKFLLVSSYFSEDSGDSVPTSESFAVPDDDMFGKQDGGDPISVEEDISNLPMTSHKQSTTAQFSARLFESQEFDDKGRNRYQTHHFNGQAKKCELFVCRN